MEISRKKLLVIAVGGLFALWVLAVVLRITFSRTDYARVARGEPPLFAWASVFVLDGGTVEYHGLGYDLTWQCRFHVKNGMPVGYDKGPILRYRWNWLLLPLTDRQDVRFVPDEGLAPPPKSPEGKAE